MSDAPNLTTLRARVPDPLTQRVLVRYVEQRRAAGTTLQEGIAAVLAEIDRGNLAEVTRLASKPDAIWDEERVLSRAILGVARAFGNRASEDSTLDAIRLEVVRVCSARYPQQPPRYVRRVVAASVGRTLHRLEIRTEQLVAALYKPTRSVR